MSPQPKLSGIASSLMQKAKSAREAAASTNAPESLTTPTTVGDMARAEIQKRNLAPTTSVPRTGLNGNPLMDSPMSPLGFRESGSPQTIVNELQKQKFPWWSKLESLAEGRNETLADCIGVICEFICEDDDYRSGEPLADVLAFYFENQLV